MGEGLAEYSVSTEGVRETAALLAKFPEISREETQKAMVSSVKQVASDVKGFTPVYMGILRSKIGGTVEVVGGPMPSVKGIVHSGGVPYALPVELGRRPGKWPPIGPLKRWAHLVLGDEGAAWAVAAKIFKKGIRPRAMFAKAWRRNKDWVNARFVLARDRIVKRLGEVGITIK